MKIMKYFSFVLSFFLVMLLNSCGSLGSAGGDYSYGGVGFGYTPSPNNSSNSGSNFFKDLYDLGNNALDQWAQSGAASPRDHEIINAWKSGSGGKALALGEVAVGILGGITKKDVSKFKNAIHNSAVNLNNNEVFNQSDINNWVGAMFSLGDELINEYKDQKYEEMAAKIDNPEAYGLDKEWAMRYIVDPYNKKITTKSNSEYLYDLMEYRKSQNESWLSDKLESICSISLDEYNKFNKDERQKIDLIILADDQQVIPLLPDDNPIGEVDSENDYKNIIEEEKLQAITSINNTIIDSYLINEYDLNDAQKMSLSEIITYLNSFPDFTLNIIGHTCDIGTDKVNDHIGLKRAEKAMLFLVESGIDSSRITITSMGETEPIYENNSTENRLKNRRISFSVSK